MTRSVRRGGGPGSATRSAHLRPVLLIVLAVLVLLLPAALVAGCGNGGGEESDAPDVLVTTTYLKDITERVAGGRMTVKALFPEGADPHGFEPTPSVARTIAESRMVIVDVFGLEPVVDELIQATEEDREFTVEAAAGLPARTSDQGELDPHFWLDPVNVMGYVENIRDALTQADPAGEAEYAANAEAYIAELQELDSWIESQVEQIPPERRLLVTNHESFGYFADRYGFEVVGTVLGTGGAGGAPSAQQLASLVAAIEGSGAPAIFLEAGSNTTLAEQVAREAGAQVVTDLLMHSTGPDAPTYIDMMRWNVTRIVEALR
jgi:ABC-type Zn uptake system ZnuABC Zn-binding protein ZnuA